MRNTNNKLNQISNGVKEKVWINIARSFREANDFDRAYYQAMTPQERLETVQFLRECYHKIKDEPNAKSGKRLRRFIKVLKQE